MSASLLFGKPSILKNLFIAFITFGIFVGSVFPFWANLFVEWKEGMLGWFVLSCIVAGVSIGFLNYWLMKLLLLKRLQCISSTATAISNNDLSRQLNVNSFDMVGDIAHSFNHMTENLRSMICQIIEVSKRLSTTCTAMNTISEETQEKVDQQKEQTEKVATSVSNMSAKVQEMDNNTSEASLAVDNASSETQKGQQEVNSTIRSIRELVSNVDKTSVVLEKLAKDSESIGSVISM